MNKRLIILLFFFTSGCSAGSPLNTQNKDSAPDHVPINISSVADAVPKYEKRTRAGNPPKYEVFGKQYKVLAKSKGYQKRGIASWYGTKFHGRKTSNGEVYDMYGMTAAHKTLPIPSYVRVTNLKNKKTIVVRVNDRGPFHENRVIDLSYTAAVKLGILEKGTGFVEVTALESVVPEASIEEDVQLFLPKQGEMAYLQVGAFNNQSYAKQLQNEMISRQILHSRIQVAQQQGSQVYKVQVGPFYTTQQIDNINEKLALIGYKKTKLIVEKEI
jgi:rare lipoprotein A